MLVISNHHSHDCRLICYPIYVVEYLQTCRYECEQGCQKLQVVSLKN